MLVVLLAGVAATATLSGPPSNNQTVVYLPCFDTGPAFALLKPRQQFSWIGYVNQVKLLSHLHGGCLSAVAVSHARYLRRKRLCAEGCGVRSNR